MNIFLLQNKISNIQIEGLERKPSPMYTLQFAVLEMLI